MKYCQDTTKRYLSPAKVNLCLKILGKREDGYHEIISLMQPVSLYDEISITITKKRGIKLNCEGDKIPANESNLAWVAAEAFLMESGFSSGIKIDLKKNIPVEAGLGGGSGDAATVLNGLNELTGMPLSKAQIYRLALHIGSDVPFFLIGSSAVARGRGELIEGIHLPSYWYILLKPAFGVSTKWAYSNLNLTNENINIKIMDFTRLLTDKTRVTEILENDLSSVVCAGYPQIRVIMDALGEAGAEGVLLSGSGSTVLGLFYKRKDAFAAMGRLKGVFMEGMSFFLVKGVVRNL